METLQAIFRAFFRAFVIAMLIINYDREQIWALPFGLLIGVLSEAKSFTNFNK